VKKELLKKIRSAKQILILTHTDPDGDAVGSAWLLQKIIQKLQPAARAGLLFDPEHKAELDYFIKKIKNIAVKMPDLIISVDASDLSRIYGLSGCRVNIKIDHHESKSSFGELNIVDPRAASCTLLIYQLARQLGLRLSKPMAEALYLGLSSDTGNFAFANTDTETLAAALECVRAGVRPNQIFNKLNEQLSFQEIRDFAVALRSAGAHCGGRLITASIPAGLKVDNRFLIDFIRREKNAQVAAVCVEKKDHIKLSLRSKSGINVAAVAAVFNGGGHKEAAAGKIYSATLAGAQKQVIQYFQKYVFPRQ
jgi:phosphoesterase RecJ-like protein